MMTTPHAIAWRSRILAAAIVLASTTGANAAMISLTATLTGTQEVPPNSSPGRGMASLVLDDVNRTLLTIVGFEGLTSPTISVGGASAHIHLAPAGSNGPIIRPFASAPVGATFGAFGNIWTGLTDAHIAALLSGNTYINIHTSAFQGGEIRGQILVVPEPWTLGLVGIGLVGAAGLARRARAGGPDDDQVG